jgi:hypothetical protein
MTVVMNEVFKAIGDTNLEEFTRWLRQEPALLGEGHVPLQVEIIEHSAWNDRGPFIARLLEHNPALLKATPRPPSSALEHALDYGNAHLIPLLTAIWPLPDDLSHAAGVGDFTRVQAWFDEGGRPRLGSLDQHYPTNNPRILRHLRWSPPNVQHVLDVAFAWSCVNKHFEIASYLLERGANIDTDWSTHEPAGILHECAVHGNYETAQFLIDHGVDLARRDYRWNGTAEGWAYYAANDERMAELLARANVVDRQN